MTLLDPVLTWVDVCALDDLEPGRGACVLVGPFQVALFRVGAADGHCAAADELYAVSNHDPFSGAYVLSRGIVGSRGEVPKVTSPVYKQGFDLRTGACLDDASVTVETFPVRTVDGRVEVGLR
jgi:nitrite reductase (NADH) small subunit